MTNDPQIPFGYKRVFGQARKGDGIWDYSAGKFVKVKKEYPWGAPLKERIIIRKCEVVQTEIPDPDRLDKSLLFPLPGVPPVEGMEVE